MAAHVSEHKEKPGVDVGQPRGAAMSMLPAEPESSPELMVREVKLDDIIIGRQSHDAFGFGLRDDKADLDAANDPVTSIVKKDKVAKGKSHANLFSRKARQASKLGDMAPAPLQHRSGSFDRTMHNIPVSGTMMPAKSEGLLADPRFSDSYAAMFIYSLKNSFFSDDQTRTRTK